MRSPMKTSLTAETLRSMLSYDPDTGLFAWLVDRGILPIKGKRAGRLSHGYVVIKICGQNLFAHRLAWLYVHGRWPVKFIDHINGDPLDNRLVNLREATRAENQRNIVRSGVSTVKGSQKYRAYIYINRKHIPLGTFATRDEARAVYLAATVKHFGSFSAVHRQSVPPMGDA